MGRLRSDAERLTDLGRRLRSASLDELPELWNVLRNEMSLVGPRPLLMEYLPRYDTHQARRHEVKPGLTGLAQVSGYSVLEPRGIARRAQYDLYYVDHRSILLDVRTLAWGLMVLLRGAPARRHSPAAAAPAEPVAGLSVVAPESANGTSMDGQSPAYGVTHTKVKGVTQ